MQELWLLLLGVVLGALVGPFGEWFYRYIMTRMGLSSLRVAGVRIGRQVLSIWPEHKVMDVHVPPTAMLSGTIAIDVENRGQGDVVGMTVVYQAEGNAALGKYPEQTLGKYTARSFEGQPTINARGGPNTLTLNLHGNADIEKFDGAMPYFNFDISAWLHAKKGRILKIRCKAQFDSKTANSKAWLVDSDCSLLSRAESRQWRRSQEPSDS